MAKHSTLARPLPLFRVQCIEIIDRNWDGVQAPITTMIQSGEQAMEYIAELDRCSFDKQLLVELDKALAHMMCGDKREGHIDSALVKSEQERWTFELRIV